LSKNNYSSNNSYGVTNPNSLSDGDDKGKGELNGSIGSKTDISERNTLLLKKPSVVEPTASQLSNLINELSPANESGIRKYFISPPSETWNPKDGTYSLNISWTYELNR
jgi:hypothetical protein